MYLEIFAHAGKLYKNIKNQATRSNWSKVGHHGPLGGAAWPHHSASRRGTSSATSLIHGKWPRNTHPSLLHRWFQVDAWSRAEKRHHMDWWLTIRYVGCSNGQMVSIPTLYYIPRGPTPKEEGPLHSGTSVGAMVRMDDATKWPMVAHLAPIASSCLIFDIFA